MEIQGWFSSTLMPGTWLLTSWMKTFIQLCKLLVRTTWTWPWMWNVFMFPDIDNRPVIFWDPFKLFTVMFAKTPARLALSVGIWTRRKSCKRVYWFCVISTLCVPLSFPSRMTASLDALLVSNFTNLSGMISWCLSSSCLSHFLCWFDRCKKMTIVSFFPSPESPTHFWLEFHMASQTKGSCRNVLGW